MGETENERAQAALGNTWPNREEEVSANALFSLSLSLSLSGPESWQGKWDNGEPSVLETRGKSEQTRRRPEVEDCLGSSRESTSFSARPWPCSVASLSLSP